MENRLKTDQIAGFRSQVGFGAKPVFDSLLQSGLRTSRIEKPIKSGLFLRKPRKPVS
jgi:hypothetical protein